MRVSAAFSQETAPQARVFILTQKAKKP